jgi:hypothetical protein
MDRKRRRFWLLAGAALAAGLLLRLWFIRHMSILAGDSLMYGDIAKNWLQHGIYGFTEAAESPGSIEIRPTLIRLPGYPLFLAACFRLFGMEHYNAVLFFQAAVDLITCCCAAALAARLFGARAALPVLWLAALCPFTANYVAAPLTETLVLCTIAVACYAFARWQDRGCGLNPWVWLIAAAVAYSILLRPEQVLFAAAIFGAILWASASHRAPATSMPRSTLPFFAAALCVALPLLAWTIRNERTFHVFQPLAPKYANDPGELAPLGFSRWYRSWAIDFASTQNVYWNYSGDPIAITDLPDRALAANSPEASQQLRDQTTQLLNDYNATTGGTPDVDPAIDARFDALGRKRIRAHPILYYLALPIARVLNMTLRPRTEFLPVELEWWKPSVPRAQFDFALAYATLNFGYISIGRAGFIAWNRRARLASGRHPRRFPALAFAMAACILLRAALLLTLDNSEPRYTLEFFPILFVCAGALFASPGDTVGDNQEWHSAPDSSPSSAGPTPANPRC